MGTSHPKLVADAISALRPLLDTASARVLVGITGAPAAGKSTLAVTLSTALCAELGDGQAVPVQMDGFHLANSELERLGLSHRKGAPETFDAAGFAHLLCRLRSAPADEVVYAPTYSRVLHESIGGVVAVPAKTRVVVVEGNYLLLQREPWTRVRSLLDLVLYLEAPYDKRLDSLLRRQQARGLDSEAAREWVLGSDEANAELILGTRTYADTVLRRPSDID